MTTLIKKHEKHLRKMFAGGKLFANPPTQRKARAVTDTGEQKYGGELRGFYPTLAKPVKTEKKVVWEATTPEEAVQLGTWFPLNSAFHKVAEKGHRKHGGIDFYAPYTVFPYEVPVLALADGRLEFVYWHSTGNSIGSQANLYVKDDENEPVFGDYIYRLIYGHLDRFIPINSVEWQKDTGTPTPVFRKRVDVRQGEVVGFIGKSGNVDTKGEATTRISPAGMGSGHLHLQLSQTIPASEVTPTKEGEVPTSKRVNLDFMSLLPFDVDKVDDLVDPKKPARRPKASKWKDRNEGYEDYSKARFEGTMLRTPDVDKLADGLTVPARKRVNKWRPNVAPWPFHGLILDQSPLLWAAYAAYKKIDIGLTGRIGPFTRAVLSAQKKALTALTPGEADKRVGSTLDDLHLLAKGAADPAQQGDPNRAARVTAALLHLIEGQYTLLGGPGFEAPSTEKKPSSNARVTSGAGVRGRLFAVASVGAREVNTHATPHLAIGYFHETWRPKKGVTPPEYEYAAMSVGFGSGTPREATFNVATIKTLTKLAETEADATKKAALEAMARYGWEILFAHISLKSCFEFVLRYRDRLMADDAEAVALWADFCNRVADVAKLQRDAADIYIDAGDVDKARQTLWLITARQARIVMRASGIIALKPTKGKKRPERVPAMPDLRLLYSETPPGPPPGPPPAPGGAGGAP